MNFKKLHSTILLSLLCWQLIAQESISNLREEKVALSDTIFFSAEFINGESIDILKPTGNTFYDYFEFQHYPPAFIQTGPAPFDSVYFSYRVLPAFLNLGTQSYDSSDVLPYVDDFKWKTSTSAKNKQSTGVDALNKSGSISRTVLGGSVQDVSIKSEMNLQLSGMLGKDTEIRASINDNNLALQQEGYSQKLQEFDQIFIEVAHKEHAIRAGDLAYESNRFSFFRANKKAAGLMYVNEKENQYLRIGGGISRGKFQNQSLNLKEGNNGPYRLRGANGESWVTVVSGSERVFLNGIRLKRGLQEDYTINYNTAEIIFTNKHLISPQMRIYVEFEYTELSYNRSLYFADATFKSDSWGLDFSFFSEQDLKFQPVLQTLSNAEKLLLNEAGDNTVLGESAIEEAYQENSLLYKKVDSLGVEGIFVFSADTSKTLYRVSFTDVGEGKGDYVQDAEASALGNIYRWVEPENGIPQGRYQALKVLIAPKQLRNFQVKLNKKWKKGFDIEIELAYSQEDKNLFSQKDDGDNGGVAFRLNQKWQGALGKKQLELIFKNSYIASKYKSPYIIRDAEFLRKWNLNNVSLENTDELWTGLEVKLSRDSVWLSSFSTDFIQKGSDYTGWRNQVESQLKKTHLDWDLKALWLNSESSQEEGNSYRIEQHLKRSKKNWKQGFYANVEQNELKDIVGQKLSAQAYSFDEWKAYINYTDSASKSFGLDIQFRNDRSLDSLEFEDYSQSIQGDLFGKLQKKWGTLRSGVKFKYIDYMVDSLTQDEQILTSNLEYSHSWKKNKIRFTGAYENGKGQEARLRISYIQVPDGQGNYIWVDYNENGIKEPDEFEQAIFGEQANYIRLLSPEDDYIAIFKHRLAFQWTFELGKLFELKENWKQLYLSTSLETGSTLKDLDWEDSWNPFDGYRSENISRQNLLSRSEIRNNFKSGIRVSIIRKEQVDTRLISFGLEENKKEDWKLLLRLPLKNKSAFETEFTLGNKFRSSENYAERNLDIDIVEFDHAWKQPVRKKWKFKSGLNYRTKLNQSERKEKLESISFYLEQEFKSGNNQYLFTKVTYLNHKYNAEEGTALGYEMLQGLKKGNNMIWELNWRKKLSKSLELNFVYQGRKSENIQAIHSGQVQLRALF